MTPAGTDEPNRLTIDTKPTNDDLLDPVAILQQVEADCTQCELPSARAEVFRRVTSLLRANGLEAEAQREEWKSWLFDFMPVRRQERQSHGARRFAPVYEIGGRAYPHVDMFPPEALAALREELERSTNPIHRALYADFIWDQREKYPGPKSHPYKAAKTAIDAYLQAARIYRENEWDDQLVDAIDRACELAQLINDPDNQRRGKETCFDLAEELVGTRTHPPVRWAIDALETLQQFGPHLSRQDHERVASLAEAGAGFYSSEGNHHMERSFLELLTVSYRALGSNDDVRAAIVRQAESFVTEADEAPKALAKLHWIEKALELYQQLGASEKVGELKRLLSQAGLDTVSDMHEIAVEVRIPREMAEGWVNQLVTNGLEAALDILGQTERFIPQLDRVRDEARKLRQRHPIQYLMSRRMLDSDGRTVQRSLSDTEQIAASEANSYNFALALGNVELGLAFDRLESEMGLTAESLMRILRSKPIFESGTLDVVSVGVERYFAKDYVSALHILVPQLEDTFRGILSKIGLSRTSIQNGISREKPLDVVLATPELRAGLGEDLATFYERFLTRPESDNVRNRMAHGLLKLDHCRQDTARRVLLCYLQLAQLNVGTKVSPDGEHSAPDDS